MRKSFSFRNCLLVLTLTGLVALTACRATLEPGGAYAPFPTTNAITGVITPANAPDMGLLTVDATYAAAYAALNGIFSFEEANSRALFMVNPNIKHTLDQLRPQAWSYNVAFHKARKAYKAVPVPANLTVLQQTLARINATLAAVQAVMPSATNSAPVALPPLPPGK